MSERIRIGDYELTEPLAQGGIGQVWRGVHASGIQVAVKVLTAEGLSRPIWVESLNAEIRAVAGLNHEHIVWIHDAGVVDAEQAANSGGVLHEGLPWLAMELADGGTLRDHPPFEDWETLRDLLMALLDALAHAHAHGIVHRDIKPANVLFSGGMPKLSDFGMVFTTDPSAHIAPIGGGTPSYMAPEQFESQSNELGPWTDLYALGCLAYALAAGRRPFKGTRWIQLYNAHLHEDPPPIQPMFPVPKGFESWLAALMAKNRHLRFQRAADALFALERIEDPTTLPPIRAHDPSEKTEVTHTEGRRILPRYPRPPIPEVWRQSSPIRQNPGMGLGLYGLRAMPFVGRKRERSILWDALNDVDRYATSRAIVIRGPAGVGKSRLANWMCRRAHEAGAAEVFRTTHGPLPGNLDGIPGLLARALRVWDLHHDVLLDGIEAELEARGIRDRGVWATLAELLQPQLDGPRLAGSQRRHDLVAKVLSAMAGHRPSVIWLDDVQWGPDAIDLCDHLLTARKGHPSLMILTVREEALVDEPQAADALEDLLSHERSFELEVEPLSRRATMDFVTQGLGLQPALAERLHQRTAGNPMFAVELVGDWVQRGLLTAGDGGFKLARLDALRTPSTVGAVWEGRLRSLFRREPELEVPMTIAAALGIEVDISEWRAACAEAGVEAVAELWTRLEELRLARRDPVAPRYAFVHGMLRETVLHRADMAGTLVDAHAAVARSLDDPGRRGLHLLEAGQIEDAGHLLLEAAEAASGTDLRSALRLLQLRDEALETHDADDPARVDGWLLASEVCRLGADPETGARWARTALHWASVRRNRELTVRALQSSASCARMTGDLVHARHHVDTAMRLSDGLPAQIRADTLFVCGATLMDSGDIKGAERATTRALTLYEDIASRVRAAALLGYILAQSGDHRAARTLLLKYLPEAEASGNRIRLADLHNALGEIARSAGRLDHAENHYRRALLTLEGTGITDPAYRANLALTLLARGEVPEARKILSRVMRESDQVGARMLTLLAHAGLAACAADQRDWRTLRVNLVALREDTGGLVAEDIAACLRYAGTHAMALEQTQLGRMALELASVQYRALGEHAIADEVLRMAHTR